MPSPNQYRPVQVEKTTVTFEVDARSLPNIDQVELKGSFDPVTGRFDPNWNEGKTLPMRDDGKGGDQKAGDGIYSLQVDLSGENGSNFWWGAQDGQGRYLRTSEHDPMITVGERDEMRTRMAPLSLDHYGLQENETNASVTAWSPTAAQMKLVLFNPAGESIGERAMKRLENGTDWRVELGSSKAELEGHSYLLKEIDDQGKESIYIDPFARKLVGQQRGLERIFVDPIGGFETGWYDDSGKGGPNYADNLQMARFSVDGKQNADEMYLILKDQSGRALGKQELEQRLGATGLTSYQDAEPKDRRDWDVLRNWQLTETPSLEPYLTSVEITPEGKIPLRRIQEQTGDGGWMGVVHNFGALQGLKYEFHAMKDGKLVADLDGNGSLSPNELARTSYNERENEISGRPGSARRTLISSFDYQPRHFDKPRIESDPARQVIYEAHVGSLLTAPDNPLQATYEDLVQRLDYLVDLGATALEVLPTSEFGGKKDWGYTVDHYFAGADGYGFSMPAAKARGEGLLPLDSEHTSEEEVFVNGTDALKWFVDKAHEKGLNVYGDVVYNHTSGKADGDNPLNSIGGENADFFRWPDGHFHETPWGRKPDFADPFVKQFFTDHAAGQLTEYGFDGLRFDFTQVLHNTGDDFQRNAGQETLRQIQRGLELVRPGNFTVAEDFSGDPMVAAGLGESRWDGTFERKGMGFDAVWNDRFRDDLFHAVEDKPGAADRLMDALLGHHGVPSWDNAVLYAHSHDEVGNSGEWLGRGAAGGKADSGVLSHLPRAKARSGAALTLLGPGIPMLWQGEEFLANNDFKHGLTSTWGQKTEWLEGTAEERATPESQARIGHHNLYKDLISLRRSSEAFLPGAPISRVMTHNSDKILGFRRDAADGSDSFMVFTHLGDAHREGYSVDLPEGQWKEVFNSESERYGGDNTGNEGGVLPGNSRQQMVLPAGGTVVFQRVAE
ncbi:MAG: alpha-amylase family glycosyl hydrolase [Vulcanimicrobiota bacterium]